MYNGAAWWISGLPHIKKTFCVELHVRVGTVIQHYYKEKSMKVNARKSIINTKRFF